MKKNQVRRIFLVHLIRNYTSLQRPNLRSNYEDVSRIVHLFISVANTDTGVEVF